MTMGLQLFLGGINEVFSSIGLNQTVVMASSFAPVPLTLMAYNKIIKKYGFAWGYRFSLVIFALGMMVMLLCYLAADILSPLALTLIAMFGGVFVSCALGAFFSVSYTIPTYLARKELQEHGNDVASMYFAVQGLFEGIAAGVATGLILVMLKKYDSIVLLPVIVAFFCVVAFVMTFWFKDHLANMGKEETVVPLSEKETTKAE